jgi:cobalamin synthase
MYGLDFLIINICALIATYQMKKVDQTNKYLQTAFQNYNNFIVNIIITCIFIVIGYYYYPPIIILSCLLSIILAWIFMYKKINLLKILEND